MEVTTEVISRYEGGQLEIQNPSEDYLYRGEVEKAWVDDGTMYVRFKWIAKMDADGMWHSDPGLDYAVSLEIASASEIGDNRIHYSVMFVGEHGTFFPPNGSRLDPSRVVGLKLY